MSRRGLFLLVLILVANVSILFAQKAHTNWGKLNKSLVIQPSLNVSAWENRSFVTNMTPVGDGTYVVRMDLTPGEYYNFIFQASTSTNSPPGIVGNSTFFDQPPSTGWIPASTVDGTIMFSNVAWFGGVTQSKDARRILKVPELASGESLYVYNNFNEIPNLPETIQALPGDQKVILNWSVPKGNWKWDDANVIAGGTISVYFNSTGASSDYSLLAQLQGNITSFTHAGLVNGTTYYYILVVSDAYLQAPGLPFANKSTPLPPPTGTAVNQASVTPRGTLPVYFKVENIDWDVVEKSKYIVWLTPSDMDGRFHNNKIPGRIVRVAPEKGGN